VWAVERDLGSTLPPAELERWDSTLFMEVKQLFYFGAPINTCRPAPRGLSWTFWHLNILLSWAYSLQLISLAWLINQSEFEWSQVHLLMSLHLVGTWVSIGCGILVTLGGCRHLDGLEAAEELWQVVLVLGHLPVICEGCCAFPGGAPKATLVNCSCHWVTSLAVGSCGALGELGFRLPISR
jgi:hypothetical protein